MTPARIWPGGFGAAPVWIAFDRSTKPPAFGAHRATVADDVGLDAIRGTAHERDHAGRIFAVDFGGPAYRATYGGTEGPDGETRTILLRFFGGWDGPPPPWPDRSPDWRPDGMIAEDFHA